MSSGSRTRAHAPSTTTPGAARAALLRSPRTEHASCLFVRAPRRKQNKGAADGPAFKFAFGLTFAYFGFCLIVFAGWLLAFGYHWNSSIVSRPENVRNFMLVSLLPGFGAAFLARRAIAVRFARKPEKFDGVQGMLNFALIESVEAFERMDSYYLTLFYWNLCAILAVCLFGLLSSQFSFILPLIFYSKYIDASTWEYRFQIMTLQARRASLGLASTGLHGPRRGLRPSAPVHHRTTRPLRRSWRRLCSCGRLARSRHGAAPASTNPQ